MSEELIEQPQDLAPNPVEVLKQKQRDNLAKARATAKANREARKKAAAEAHKARRRSGQIGAGARRPDGNQGR